MIPQGTSWCRCVYSERTGMDHAPNVKECDTFCFIAGAHKHADTVKRTSSLHHPQPRRVGCIRMEGQQLSVLRSGGSRIIVGFEDLLQVAPTGCVHSLREERQDGAQCEYPETLHRAYHNLVTVAQGLFGCINRNYVCTSALQRKALMKCSRR